MTTATGWASPDWMGAARSEAVVDAAYRAPRTSTMSIVAVLAGVAGWTVLPVVGAIGAVILGWIALVGIRRTGDEGRWLAIAGIVLGALGIVIGIVGTVQVIMLIVQMTQAMGPLNVP